MFLLHYITYKEWKDIKSTRKAYSFCKDSKLSEYSLEELNCPVSEPLRTVENSSFQSANDWLMVSTPELKVVTRCEQVEVIPLKEGVEKMFFSALNNCLKQKAASIDTSFTCFVVETVIAVVIDYHEQCLQQYLSQAAPEKVSGYWAVERIGCNIRNLLKAKDEVDDIRESLFRLRTLLHAHQGGSVISSRETLVQSLSRNNGIMNCLFSCLQVKSNCFDSIVVEAV